MLLTNGAYTLKASNSNHHQATGTGLRRKEGTASGLTGRNLALVTPEPMTKGVILSPKRALMLLNVP